ncbi:MAG: hypothetical protein LUD48_05795 [Prevotella sp.]|nr:hypothetical protein [Prevotella sp.]
MVEKSSTYKQFINNMELKMQDGDFLGDTKNLIRPKLKYDPHEAYMIVKEQLISRLL